MKTLEGIVVSTKMQNTIVVEVTRKVAHPLYRKLLKRSKKFKASPQNFTIAEGDVVRIAQARPMSKEKSFQVVEVVKSKKKQEEGKIGLKD